MPNTTPRPLRRNGAGLPEHKVAALVGRIARHTLAEGERVRVQITGRDECNPFYLAGRIVGGEHGGKITRLDSVLLIERDDHGPACTECGGPAGDPVHGGKGGHAFDTRLAGERAAAAAFAAEPVEAPELVPGSPEWQAANGLVLIDPRTPLSLEHLAAAERELAVIEAEARIEATRREAGDRLAAAEPVARTVDTTVECSWCGQPLTVTVTVADAGERIAVECGGEGEGSCDGQLDGDPTAERTAEAALTWLGA